MVQISEEVQFRNFITLTGKDNLTSVTMTFSEFLRENNVSFVKATQKGTGLNLRTSEGSLVATIMTSVPADILAWVKERLEFTATISATDSGNTMLRLAAPVVVDYGESLESLFAAPATGKKVKA